MPLLLEVSHSIWIEFFSSCEPYLLQPKLIDPWDPALKKVYVFAGRKEQGPGNSWPHGPRDTQAVGRLRPAFGNSSFHPSGF